MPPQAIAAADLLLPATIEPGPETGARLVVSAQLMYRQSVCTSGGFCCRISMDHGTHHSVEASPLIRSERWPESTHDFSEHCTG